MVKTTLNPKLRPLPQNYINDRDRAKYKNQLLSSSEVTGSIWTQELGGNSYDGN